MTLHTDEVRVYIHQEADIRELTDLDQDLIDRVRARIRMVFEDSDRDQDAVDEAEMLMDLLTELTAQRIEKILVMALRDLWEDRDPCLDGLLASEKELYFAARASIGSCAERLGVQLQEAPS